jgi:hypothetical protein
VAVAADLAREGLLHSKLSLLLLEHEEPEQVFRVLPVEQLPTDEEDGLKSILQVSV